MKHDDHRDAAREVLRGFVEKIVIPHDDGLLQVVGNLGAMLEAAAGQKVPGRQAVGNVGCGGTQPSVLAAMERGGVMAPVAHRELAKESLTSLSSRPLSK